MSCDQEKFHDLEEVMRMLFDHSALDLAKSDKTQVKTDQTKPNDISGIP
jgi:hypothetical protein